MNAFVLLDTADKLTDAGSGQLILAALLGIATDVMRSMPALVAALAFSVASAAVRRSTSVPAGPTLLATT